MFAVLSDKPQKAERFIIKVDRKISKPKIEISVTNPTKNKLKITENTIMENTIPPKIQLNAQQVDTQTTKASIPELTENKEIKRPKIRLSTIKVGPYQQNSNNGNGNNDTNMEKKLNKKTIQIKTKWKKINRDGNYNCGRWTPDEHQRFIEAIMKFGNEWKQVQKHVGSRSSTQARSHAQKFFVKIKKSNVLDFNLDLTKNSIKTLHELANTMNSDEYFNAMKALNCVAFERRNNIKRKNKKDDTQMNESSLVNGESQNTMFINSDEIFSLITNDQTLLNSTNSHSESKLGYMSKNIDCYRSQSEGEIIEDNIIYGDKQKIETNKENVKQNKSKSKSDNSYGNTHTIIINNNINNYHYNVNINNYNNHNCDNYTSKKRNRWNSFESLFNLFPDLAKEGFNNNFNFRKAFDDKDYVDNFEFAFKETKNDFDCEKDILQEIVMLSNSEDSLKNNNKRKSEKNNFDLAIVPFFEDIKINFDKEIKGESAFGHNFSLNYDKNLEKKEKEFDVFNFFTGHVN